MSELTSFEQAYFIQTRQEIDSERRARDQLLIITVILLAAIAVAVLCSEWAQAFLEQPEALAVHIPALAILSTLFWLRRRKLQRMADGWFALRAMAARQFGLQQADELLEGITVRDLTRWRCVAEDFTLNVVFSLPIYCWLVLQATQGLAYAEGWRTVVSILAITMHVFYTYPVLGRRLRAPSLPAADPDSTTQTSA